MKKIAFILLIFSAAAAFGAGQTFQKRPGLYVISVEKALNLPEDDIDLATAVLLVGKRWDPSINIDYYRNKVDQLASTVISRLNGRGPMYNSRETIDIINKLLFDELGFKPIDNADNPQDLFLHTVLDNKRGYCLSLSILYLSIAERLGMPISGVVVPGHFFVRYSDGTQKINIETTQKGANAPDKHYITEFKIPTDDRKTIYLNNLGKKETIGCFFNNLANIYFNLDDLDNAYYYQQKAVEITPLLAEARTNLGNILLKKDMVDMAIEQYTTAIKINSQDAKTHHNLGNAYRKKELFDRAVEQYNIALKLDPNYIEIYKGLAQAYHSQGLTEKAIVILNKAIDVNSRDPDIYTTLGGIYQDKQNYYEAISKYRLALVLKSDSVPAAYGLAYAYFQNQMYYDAIEQFRTVLYYEPDNAKAHFGLALAYNKLGWTEDETEAYQKAVKADPQMAPAWQNLAQIYMTQKQYTRAIEAYQQVIKISPSADIFYNVAVAYSSQKLNSQAEQYYLKAVELNPDYPEAHNNLAITLYMLKKYESALEHALTAKKLGFNVSEDLIEQLQKLTGVKPKS
jgi:tetratricopeptide (TPR) repeat protein